MSRAPVVLLAAVLAVLCLYAGTQALLYLLSRPSSDTASLQWTAHTSAEKATVYLTNPTRRPIQWCGKATVGPTVESILICATVPGYSTSVTEAVYPIGSVKKACPTKGDLLKSVDWDRCKFEITNLN